MEIEIIRPDTHNLAAIAREMTGNRWKELGHNYNVRFIRRFCSNPNNFFLLAYIDDQVAGMLVAYLQQKMDVKRRAELYLDELETKPRFRRSGVATALMQRLFEVARKHRATEIWVLTQHDNKPAKNLYAGFRHHTHEGKLQFYSYRVTTR
jgi:ribosomal protein S18 acetylase RimI-like enzyme